MSGNEKSPSQDDAVPSPPPPAEASTVCLRCGTRGPVGDDGFCDTCEKALEQACL